MNRTWGPFPFGQLRDELDRTLRDWFGELPGREGSDGYPPINLWEQADHLLVEAELPGVKSEDLDIAVVGNELTIKGSRPGPTEEGATFHRRERGHGNFVRVVRLPVEVDSDNVQAELKHGVLTVTLPKAAAARPRKVQINVS